MLLELIAGLALLGPAPDEASLAGPSSGSEVDEQAALLILVGPTAGAELELVLGAHLRAVGLPPRFELCADAEACEARVATWASRTEAGALIWLEERGAGWVVHGLGPGRAPRVRELGGLDIGDAAQLETLAQATASLAMGVAAEPTTRRSSTPTPRARRLPVRA